MFLVGILVVVVVAVVVGVLGVVSLLPDTAYVSPRYQVQARPGRQCDVRAVSHPSTCYWQFLELRTFLEVPRGKPAPGTKTGTADTEEVLSQQHYQVIQGRLLSIMSL